MQVDHNNPRFEYDLNGEKLTGVEEETDLGVTIQKTLKSTKQCRKAANTATAIMKTIQRNFHYRDKKVYVKLYKHYVRPHLEFAEQTWSLGSSDF
jgi:hypothetical protein